MGAPTGHGDAPWEWRRCGASRGSLSARAWPDEREGGRGRPRRKGSGRRGSRRLAWVGVSPGLGCRLGWGLAWVRVSPGFGSRLGSGLAWAFRRGFAFEFRKKSVPKFQCSEGNAAALVLRKERRLMVVEEITEAG